MKSNSIKASIVEEEKPKIDYISIFENNYNLYHNDKLIDEYNIIWEYGIDCDNGSLAIPIIDGESDYKNIISGSEILEKLKNNTFKIKKDEV